MKLWVALKTAPRRELTVCALLPRYWDADAFTPVQDVPDIRASRIQGKAVTRERAYLPGFVIAGFRESPQWHVLFNAPFIRDAIRRADGTVAALHPKDLERLYAMRSRDEHLAHNRRVRNMLTVGSRVTLNEGPLAGQDFELVELRGRTGKIRLRLFDSERLVEAPLDSMSAINTEGED